MQVLTHLNISMFLQNQNCRLNFLLIIYYFLQDNQGLRKTERQGLMNKVDAGTEVEGGLVEGLV